MKRTTLYLWFFLAAQGVLLVAAFAWQMFGVDHHSGMARVGRVSADIRGGLKTALEMFQTDCGRYPTEAEGLKVLVRLSADDSLKGWRGPYFDPPEIPKDPWGHEYVYRFPAIYSMSAYDLYSLGPDGVSRSAGNDPDDIGNWDKPLDAAVAELDYNENLTRHFVDALWLIPISYCMRLALGVFSPTVREVMSKNSRVDTVWLAMALAAAIFWLMAVPQLAGR